MRTISIFIVAVVLLLFQACSENGVKNEEQHQGEPPQARALSTHEKELVSSGNDFSFGIFRKITEDDAKKNVFISPLSISMALGMTLNGAKAQTKDGIKKTLGVDKLNLAAINHSYRSLMKLLLDMSSETEIDLGNSLWVRKGFAIESAFKDSLATYFDARAEELDFAKPEASYEINGWVNNQTKGRIKSIVPDNISGDIMMYLINTIYFKGRWAQPFDKKLTQKGDFHLSDGSTAQVDMMQQTMPVATYQSDDVQMARLAYSDSLFNMTILMPEDSSVSIDRFVKKSLTAENLASWNHQLHKSERRVQLPKFESSYKKKLSDVLKTMGMDEAFIPDKADFGNINPEKDLCISEVMHKANITVDEEGSEAAAATSVGARITSLPAAFEVNRPFVYLIRARPGGAILFMGVMRNPSSTH